MADQYWSNVVLALPMNGANGSTTFTDISPVPKTVTRYGNAQISTAQSKFGGASAYFDGSGDYLTVPYSGLALTNVSFTMEFYIRFSVVPGSSQYAAIISRREAATVKNEFALWYGGTEKWYFSYCPVGAPNQINLTGMTTHTPSANTWYNVALVRNGTALDLFIDGVKQTTKTVTETLTDSTANLMIGASSAVATYFFNGYIQDLRITKGVARYTANFTPPTVSYFSDVPFQVLATLEQAWGEYPIIAADLLQPWGVKLGSDLHQPWTNAPQTRANLTQPWGDASAARANLTQPWGDASAARANLHQPWGSSIPQRAALNQPWDDAAAARANLHQPWASSIPQRAALNQPWDDAAAARANLTQPWASSIPQRANLLQGWTIFGVIVAELAQRWAISADLTRGELLQGWDLRERDLLHADLVQRWAIEADGTDVAGSGSDGVMRYQIAVQVGGMAVGVSQLNIEGGSDGDTLSCELQMGTEAEYLLCTLGSTLAVRITSIDGTDDFVFVITDARISEEHGKTTYAVEAESPGVLLGDSYAAPVGGELSGMASAVAASLAGNVPLRWQTVDWEIPPATWTAAGDTPLALLKTLAAAVGAVVQSLPDGSLLVVPEYEAAVNLWSAAAPGVSLTENLDCFATGSDPDYKSGCNWYLIASQQTSTDTLRLEETEISSTLKEVRGYQTPWTGAFALAHTGGDWVAIEPMGREDRQETETVEFVAGAGKVKYPIYAVESTQWQQTNLGSVALAEDGSLTAAVAAQSLLTITYTTRCLLWRVRDPNNEQLQLVVEL